jgi:hypothetical protein
VELQHWFPDNPIMEFFPGKLVTCVIGVRNNGGAAVNISAAVASLASPFNADVKIYNFTAQVRTSAIQLIHPFDSLPLEKPYGSPSTDPPPTHYQTIFFLTILPSGLCQPGRGPQG